MFNPKYTITQKLLKNIKNITALSEKLNNKQFPDVILMEFKEHAHDISTFASTSIEGNPIPLTDVKELLKHHPQYIRDTEKEVLNYNEALISLEKIIKTQNSKVDMQLILNTHKIVMNGLIIKSKCGKIRREPVFVNDPKLRRTIYWPPNHDETNELLKNLIEYVSQNENRVDPLILAGIFHKQFVVIHPFLDGNGRTVRLLTKVLLSNMGLNTFNLFSFENYYNKNVSNYFKNVGVKGDYYDIAPQLNFTKWLEYFTDGIIDELLRVSNLLEAATLNTNYLLKPHHKLILNYIETNGFINDAEYSNITDRAKATRNQDLNKLIEIGLIERHGVGRSTIYKMALKK